MSLQTWTHNSQKASSLPPSWPAFKWDPSSPDPIYFRLKWSLCFLRRCSWALLTIAGRCKMILPLWCRRWLTRLRHFGNVRRWLLCNALSQLLNYDYVEKWVNTSIPYLGLDSDSFCQIHGLCCEFHPDCGDIVLGEFVFDISVN